MKKLFAFSLIFSISLLYVNCGGKSYKYDSSAINPASGKAGLFVDVQWLKNKRDTLDLRVMFTNGYNHAIRFNKQSIKMTFNGQPSMFNTDDFDIILGPQTSEARTMVFKFEPEIGKTGTAVFTIDPIFKGDFPGSGAQSKVSPIQITMPVPPKGD